MPLAVSEDSVVEPLVARAPLQAPEAVHADVVRVVDELLTVRGWGT